MDLASSESAVLKPPRKMSKLQTGCDSKSYCQEEDISSIDRKPLLIEKEVIGNEYFGFCRSELLSLMMRTLSDMGCRFHLCAFFLCISLH